MYGSLAVVLWCKLTLVEVVAYTYKGLAVTLEDSPCEDGYMYIPIAFLVLLYLVYLVECWYSEIRIEIYYKEETDTVYDRIRRIREAYPVVWWRAISYHYNRHTRQVTRYRHGDTYTTTQEYYERINTHSAAGAFDFTECGVKDVSKHLLCLEDHPITRVTFTKNFMFLNEEAEYDYLSQRARFFSENDGRDENMETREGLSLTDVEFTDEMVSYAFSNKLPWYFSLTVFWTLSLCLLSWPYRLLVSYKTALVDYQIEKLFGTNFASGMVTIDTWNGETMQITRVSTADSDRSLESMIRGNRHVVPSYSEALLMDIANGNCPRPGMTPNGTLNASSRSIGGSDGLLNNGRLTVNGRSGRTSSITSAHRLSATSPLLGGPLGAFGRAYRSIVGISQIPLKDRVNTGANGHVPSNMQLIPSVTGSGSMHQLSNGNAKPIENGGTPNGFAGGIRARGEGLQSPNGDVRHTTSFTDETDVRTRKNSCSGDGQKTGPNKSRKRPTSLPLCLGNRMASVGDRGNDGEQRTVQSCLVVDSRGVRTVLCHQQGPHHHPPAPHAPSTTATIPEPQTASTHNDIPVTPGCSPPAYEVAIEMQVPSQDSSSNEPRRGLRASSSTGTSGGRVSTTGDQPSGGQMSEVEDGTMNLETSL